MVTGAGVAVASLLGAGVLAAHADWATWASTGLVGFGKGKRLAYRAGLYSVVPLLAAVGLLYARRVIGRAHAWRSGDKPPPRPPG